MTTPAELEYIRALRAIGFNKARELFDILQSAPTDDFISPYALTSHCQRGRRRGQIDPHCTRQRVYRAVREVLRRGPIPRSELLLEVEEITGIPMKKVKSHAAHLDGVKRHCGVWSFSETELSSGDKGD